MSGPIDLGDSLPLEYLVADSAGAPVNAATAVLTVTPRNGAPVTVPVTASPTGTYNPTTPYVPATAGEYTVRFLCTGPPVAITDVYNVQSADPQGLFSLDDARTILQLPSGDTSKDGLLREYIAGVTTVVERICGPQILRAVTQTYNGGKVAILLPSNVSAVTTVVESGITLTPVTDYTVDTRASILYRGSTLGVTCFKSGIQNISVTFTKGNQAVPANVLLGARLILRHTWQGTQQGFRPQLGAPDTAVETVNGIGYLIPHQAMAYLQASPALPGFA